MSLFSKILDKLGLRKDPEEQVTIGTEKVAPPDPTSPNATWTPKSKGVPPASPTGAAPTSEKGVPSAMPSVADKRQKPGVAVRHTPAPISAPRRAISQRDVMNLLEEKAKGTGLNWRQSISDLLVLLDLDNSREARTELAKELNAPQEVMGDSARMNTWLHKEVLRKIAENGGNIPQELLD
jgi:hypothetical protein